MKLTILGCGSSGGVPRMGEGWGACDPDEPRNRRRRCSILLQYRENPSEEPTQILIDMSPDLREQLLEQNISRLDGIALTHPHADHIHGIDDVRQLVLHNHKMIDVYMDAPTAKIVTHSFGYVFTTPQGSLYPPLLTEHRIEADRHFTITGPGGDVTLWPFRLHHGEIDSLGFRIGQVAYTPDLNAIPPASLIALERLDLWIVDALRLRPHPSHFSLDEALSWIERLKPKRAVLTNLHTDLDYRRLQAQLPAHITPAYDGMVLDC